MDLRAIRTTRTIRNGEKSERAAQAERAERAVQAVRSVPAERAVQAVHQTLNVSNVLLPEMIFTERHLRVYAQRARWAGLCRSVVDAIRVFVL